MTNNTELRLYQSWFRHYIGRGRPEGPRSVAETLADALDARVDVDRVLDAATADTDRFRERAYRRSRRFR